MKKLKSNGSTRCVGTRAAGIIAPIIRAGDPLQTIVVQSVSDAVESGDLGELSTGDTVAITESIVAKWQRNFVTLEEIAEDLRRKFPDTDTIAVVFPILSRNRFSKILEAIKMVFKKVFILLSYPDDEVGNYLISKEDFYNSGISKERELSAAEMYQLFGTLKHEITGVDYVKLYENIGEEKVEVEVKVIFANNPEAILKYSTNVIAADIHSRERTKSILRKKGARVYGLDDIMNQPINNSGYNPMYGLLGSNMSTENTLKLFPRDCQSFVEDIQKMFYEKFGVIIEVMVYGDGAYKDPTSEIWELADPVVSPGYTSGLEGTPNEVKLKYIADDKLANVSQKEAQQMLKDIIRSKTDNKADAAVGTTPRKIASLLGSLSDLVSGSGDKGTPIVVIQGYFKNYAD